MANLVGGWLCLLFVHLGLYLVACKGRSPLSPSGILVPLLRACRYAPMRATCVCASCVCEYLRVCVCMRACGHGCRAYVGTRVQESTFGSRMRVHMYIYNPTSPYISCLFYQLQHILYIVIYYIYVAKC